MTQSTNTQINDVLYC